MDEIPAKQDGLGNVVPPLFDSPFTRKQIMSRAFVKTKSDQRKEKLGVSAFHPSHTLSHIRRPLDELLDKEEFASKRIDVVYSLEEMEKQGLMSASLPVQPWSGPYWPIYQGGIGSRYASDSFESAGGTWQTYYDFIAKKDPLATVIASGERTRIDELSPAEKYDFLISLPQRSDNLGSLTTHAWNEGQFYVSAYGDVEPWMGLCHGWAAAAFSAPRPVRSVTTIASDERTGIKFFPNDLKGLSSHVWAQARVPSAFVGSRCNDKNPDKDTETGRVLDEGCFDTNPAVWHISAVNQIGKAKRSFVMDATYDYEVWNQPVSSYSYKYFNPQTGKPAESWKDAAVDRQRFSKDKFKKFRSIKAKRFVGIEMSVTYIAENSPDHSETDTEQLDAIRTVSYMYDLELDSDDRIIGGEWYTNNHPDFLWLPNFDLKPALEEDSVVRAHGEWTPDRPLPPFWRHVALQTARSSGELLPAIVDALMDAASE